MLEKQNRDVLILSMDLDLELWQKLYNNTQQEYLRKRLRAIKYLYEGKMRPEMGNLDGAIKARKFYNAKQLAKKVKDTIQKNNDLTVEPCTLAFNYGGHNLDYFAMAQKAAKHLDPDSLDGIQTINRLLEQYIQWDQFGDDDQDYLDQILEATGG